VHLFLFLRHSSDAVVAGGVTCGGVTCGGFVGGVVVGGVVFTFIFGGIFTPGGNLPRCPGLFLLGGGFVGSFSDGGAPGFIGVIFIGVGSIGDGGGNISSTSNGFSGGSVCSFKNCRQLSTAKKDSSFHIRYTPVVNSL